MGDRELKNLLHSLQLSSMIPAFENAGITYSMSKSLKMRDIWTLVKEAAGTIEDAEKLHKTLQLASEMSGTWKLSPNEIYKSPRGLHSNDIYDNDVGNHGMGDPKLLNRRLSALGKELLVTYADASESMNSARND